MDHFPSKENTVQISGKSKSSINNFHIAVDDNWTVQATKITEINPGKHTIALKGKHLMIYC